MSETLSTSLDRAAFDADYSKLVKAVPTVVRVTVPDATSKQRAVDSLLAGGVEPVYQEYPELAALSDETVDRAHALAEQLYQHTTHMSEIEAEVCRGVIGEKMKQMDLVLAMRDYNAAANREDKADAAERYMRANIDLYGEPDRTTYQSLLSEKVARIATKRRSPAADQLFTELTDMLPSGVGDASMAEQRFRPSDETIQWMNHVVHGLFDGMLRHVPEAKDTVTAEELSAIFQSIIDEEFEDETWGVRQKQAKAVSVNSGSRRVTVPIDRQPMGADEARRLVVHELGVHVMTAVTGESTTLRPLGRGLAGYSTTQEGLGKVMEQALEGNYIEAGVDHYITAGLAYFDQKDFRGAYEIKWRMKLLEDIAEGVEPTDEQIQQAKRLAIDGPGIATARIFRGTDELPLFKDLSYYNGTAQVWRYLESIRDDDLQLGLLLAGKIDLSPQHQRVVLESHSR